MTTPTGTIAMTDIQTEFGGSNPIALDEYYAGGLYVPSGTTGVPSSGQISMDNLRGKTKVTNVTATLTPSTVQEESWVTITITDANPNIYPILYWKLTNYDNLDNSDFNIYQGQINYESYLGYWPTDTFKPIIDASYEGSGTFNVTFYSNSARTNAIGTTNQVTVTDKYTTTTPTLSRTTIYRYANLDTAYRASVVTMTYSGLDNATIYYEVYTDTPGATLTSADIDAPITLTGTLTGSAGQVQLTVRSTDWNGTQDITIDKSVRVRFRLGSASGALLGTSPSITLYRMPVVSVAWSPTTIRESEYTLREILSEYVPHGAASIYYNITGTALTTDWVLYLDGTAITTTGEVTLTSSYLTTFFSAKQDNLNESNETTTWTFRINSTTGTAFWANTLTIQNGAPIYAANNDAQAAYVTSVAAYPLARTIQVLWQQRPSGTSTWSTTTYNGSANDISIPAFWTGNSVFFRSDPGGNSQNIDFRITYQGTGWASTTSQSLNNIATIPIGGLTMAFSGTNAPGASRTLTANITGAGVWPTSRVFQIEFRARLGGTTGAFDEWRPGALGTATVGANSSTSGTVQVWSNPQVGSIAYDVQFRVKLAGNELKESTQTFTNQYL